jgi:hypothetical protein
MKTPQNTPAKHSPMPPTKQAKQKPGMNQTRINEVFAKNLEEMIRWYRRASNGPDVGAYVIVEIVLRDVSLAWSLALQGKNWTPPAPTP